jgi:hypothetical protein
MVPEVNVSAEPAEPTAPAEPTPPAPRSRRAVLAAAVGGLVGSIATALGRPEQARAAAGDPMVVGQDNFAGSAATRLYATSSGGALWMTQYGFGSGIRGDSVSGHGGVFSTQHADRSGVVASNTASSGQGAAITAQGGSNRALYASADGVGSNVIEARHTAVALSSASALAAYAGGGFGVSARSESSYGIFGYSQHNEGIYGSSADSTGIHGSGSPGVYGSSTNTAGTGVAGHSYGGDGHGVVGTIAVDSGTAAGVYGESAGSTSFAAYFAGQVAVTGTLSKGGGSFRIDHPLDPANRILQHSFVESPDMLNIYNGLATTDARGEVTVELPVWFEALNRDIRYQLTPVGGWTEAWIAREVEGRAFTIATRVPHARVSWQLTGIRRDAWAEANRIEVELDKPAGQRGRYIHPKEHGQPASKGVDYSTHQSLAAARNAPRPPLPGS